MGGSFVIQPTETYPACQYVVKNPATWNPAATSAADLDGCTTLAAGERVLCPSGTSVGIWVASSATVCVADPTFVVHEGYTVRCVRSTGAPVYRQTAASGTAAFEQLPAEPVISPSGSDDKSKFATLFASSADGKKQGRVKPGNYTIGADSSTNIVVPGTRVVSDQDVDLACSHPGYLFYGAGITDPVDLVSTTIASAPAIASRTLIVDAFANQPTVGRVFWAQHAAGVGGCTYELLARGIATFGTTDVTAAALYGAGGTLNGLTIILNINGAGATTLTLNGATNAANQRALVAAIKAQWTALFDCYVGGTASNKLTLAATSIVIGAGTANTALGITTGTVDTTYAALVTDRPIIWPYVIGDTVTEYVTHPHDISMDLRGMTAHGTVGQELEFTKCDRVSLRNVNFELREGETTGDSYVIGYDVGCRNSEIVGQAASGNRLANITGGLYFQSTENCIARDCHYSFAGTGIAWLDVYACTEINCVTSNCQYAKEINAFEVDGSSFGNKDVNVLGSHDIGSAVARMIRQSTGTTILAEHNRNNLSYGLFVSSGSTKTTVVGSKYMDGAVGIYVDASATNTQLVAVDTSGNSSVGIQCAGDVIVNGWNSTQTLSGAFFGTFNGSQSLIRNFNLVNTAALKGVYADTATGAAKLSISGGSITVNTAAGACIYCSAAVNIVLSDVKLTGQYGAQISGGAKLTIGPGCDLSGCNYTTYIAPAVWSDVTVMQTGGCASVVRTSSSIGLTWAQHLNTAIEVTGVTTDNVIVYILMPCPGLTYDITNGQSGPGTLTIKVLSEAGAGVVIAQGKTARVRVNRAGQCVRVTADT